MFELGQRVAGVVDIRVGHCRVFAQYIHAANVASVDRVHDFDHGQTLFRRKVARTPDIGEGRPHSVIHDRLVVRQEHRDQARIRSALHVVLAAQGMQPSAGTTDLTGHQRKTNQAARVICAVDVLGNPHAPEDHTCLGPGEGAGDVAQYVRLDPADRGHFFGREAFQMLFHRSQFSV